MSPQLADTGYWLRQAEEACAQANKRSDPDARRTLLEIAENDEQLAEQAEARRKTGTAVKL